MEVQEISWRGRKKKEGEDKVNKGRLTNVRCSLTHEADLVKEAHVSSIWTSSNTLKPHKQSSTHIAVIEFKQVNAIPKQSQNVKFRSRAT
jgi:hypothetical protein